MRSSIYRRRARANDLRVFVRDDAPDVAEDPESSDSEDEGEPDTPSPVSNAFPSTPVPTESSTQLEGGTSPTSSPDSVQPTALSSSANVSPAQTTSVDTGVAQSTLPQNGETLQAQSSQTGDETPGRSRDGAIVAGTVGGALVVAAIIFIVWKWRRRRNRARRSLFSESTSSSSGFRRIGESQPQATTNYEPAGKTQSRIMDDLMAAAYAAEDGNASQYGAYADEKQRLNASVYGPNLDQPMPTRQSNTMVQQGAANTDRSSQSLYVNQLLSGFYKGSRTDGLAVPPGAKMPPPAAPSVAGRTEVTTNTESTWRTWGWSQKKEAKETWVDKCIRLGGLR